MKLDLEQYLTKDTEIIISLGNGLEVKGDISALTLLKVAEINQLSLTDSEGGIKTLEIIFGKDGLETLNKSLSVEGIMKLIESLGKNLNPSNEEVKEGSNSPSE